MLNETEGGFFVDREKILQENLEAVKEIKGAPYRSCKGCLHWSLSENGAYRYCHMGKADQFKQYAILCDHLHESERMPYEDADVGKICKDWEPQEETVENQNQWGKLIGGIKQWLFQELW